MKASTGWSRGAWALLSFLILLTIWSWAASRVSEIILPSPGQTLRALQALAGEGRLLRALVPSVMRGLTGFGLALLLGIPLGLAMGFRPWFRQLLRPWIVILQTTPVIAWILLAMIWFGFNSRVVIFTVTVSTLPLVAFNLMEGVGGLDPGLTQMARSFRVGRWRTLIHLYLPGILSPLLAAIAAGVGLTWKAVAMAELLTYQAGIGAQMALARTNLQTAEVFAWTGILVGLGLITDGLVRALEKALPWRRSI